MRSLLCLSFLSKSFLSRSCLVKNYDSSQSWLYADIFVSNLGSRLVYESFNFNSIFFIKFMFMKWWRWHCLDYWLLGWVIAESKAKYCFKLQLWVTQLFINHVFVLPYLRNFPVTTGYFEFDFMSVPREYPDMSG